MVTARLCEGIERLKTTRDAGTASYASKMFSWFPDPPVI